MRLVLDTNMLVSALLKPGSVPDRALSAIWARAELVLYDGRMAEEYRDVLSRPKFRGLDPGRIEELFAKLASQGKDVGDVACWDGKMSDESDRIFVEVALAGRATAIVTGNLRDYPTNLGFAVYPPATVLALLT